MHNKKKKTDGKYIDEKKLVWFLVSQKQNNPERVCVYPWHSHPPSPAKKMSPNLTLKHS